METYFAIRNSVGRYYSTEYGAVLWRSLQYAYLFWCASEAQDVIDKYELQDVVVVYIKMEDWGEVEE